MSHGETDLHGLCAYGLPPTRSAALIDKYGDEDSVPLSEFDATRPQEAQEY